MIAAIHGFLRFIISQSCSDNLTRMLWRGLELFLKRPGKSGIILKTACIACFRNAHSVLNLCFRQQQTLFTDVGTDGISGFRFEQSIR